MYLPKIGWVPFWKSRDIEGTIKNVTVSRHGDHWYVSFQVEIEIPDPLHPSDSAIGIDMGIATFAALSDGQHIEPLDAFRKVEAKLAREQQKLSRKVKFSHNWIKQKQKVNRVHTRIANLRHDFLHKHSTEISKNHAVVVVEDLQVSTMSRSAKGTVEKPGRNVAAKSGLNKAILDQGWGMFRRMLAYKQLSGVAACSSPYLRRTRRKRVPSVGMYRLRTESFKPCSPVLPAGIQTMPTSMLPASFSRSD